MPPLPQETGHEHQDLPADGCRAAINGEEPELGQAGQQRQHPPGQQRLRRHQAGDAERGDAHPAQRQQRRNGGGRRHADRDREDVRRAERQLGGEERLADERDARDRDAQQQEDPEPGRHPRDPATVDSVAASQETCLRVAPTSRIAANRCSRRAADSRVAVAMKISTGSGWPAPRRAGRSR
jgi:hypothetical protein